MRAHATRDERGSDAERARPVVPPTTPAQRMPALQRAAGNAAVARALSEERHVHDAGCGHGPSVQRSAVHDVLRSPGRPLDGPLKQEMEGRFGGEDFGSVRMHSDAAALDSAAEIGAEAYTSGSHIVWDGKDKTVLAEELHHTRQQARGDVPGTEQVPGLRISDPGDWAETEARQVARSVMSGPAPAVQRAAAGETAGADRVGTVVQRSPSTSGGRVTKGKGRGGAKKGVSPAEAVRDALVALGWQAHGANQSLTLHLPQAAQAGQTGATAGSTKASQIYGGSANVMGKRSYEGDRTKQVLRWISTVVNRCLIAAGQRPEEVQAGLSTQQGEDQEHEQEAKFQLYISTNRKRVNEIVRGEAGADAAEEYLLGLLERMVPDGAREERHTNKLRALLAKKATEEAHHPDFWPVVRSLSGAVEVPVPTTDGKHAERTIMGAAPEGSMGQHDIAGVKRPCVSCFLDLYQGSGRHPGPVWTSGAANAEFADYAVDQAAALAARIHNAITAAGGTFVSLVCEESHNVAWDHDTSSDSSAPSSDHEAEPMDTTV
ncbi:DUF4157 domain-containing protein [Streptomyces sp. NPDC001714]|uniref:eCIS core domain-containing protein n=1 Tax=Streptomyces sp. NPDC001714 TaxID=3364603 RepID=UPI0036C012E4